MYRGQKRAGEDKIVFSVGLYLKLSIDETHENNKKQLRIEVVFVQPYVCNAVDYLRPYFLLKRSTRPSA